MTHIQKLLETAPGDDMPNTILAQLGVAERRYELIAGTFESSFRILQNHIAIQQRPQLYRQYQMVIQQIAQLRQTASVLERLSEREH